MNGIDLDINILRQNLAFIREEITRITTIKEQLETNPGARSDDSTQNLRGNTFKPKILVKTRV